MSSGLNIRRQLLGLSNSARRAANRVAIELLEDRRLLTTVFGVTTANALVRFDSATPGTLIDSAAITGLQPGENVLGIDFRPANGQLYALGSSSRLYTIDFASAPGVATATQVGTAGAFTLSGTEFGFDFNPIVDRIRVVSDTNQDLRLNPNDGTLSATDTPLAYAGADTNAAADPNVVGSAYTNNSNLATTTTLYGIDSSLDVLVTQNPPNAGTLNTVGALGVNAVGPVGFDIHANGIAFATISTDGVSSRLYTLSLVTGAATLVGSVGAVPTLLRGMAVSPDQFSNTTLVGTTATFNGSTGSDTIRFEQAGGLLKHNRFSAGDSGFNSDFDFDPATPGDQTLSATDPAVTVIVNGGAFDDTVTIGSAASPAGILFVTFSINGQGGADTLIIDDSSDIVPRNVTITSTAVTGINGPINYGTLEKLVVNNGSGADIVDVQGAVPMTNLNLGDGDDRLHFSAGADLSGGYADGGPGNDTLDYTQYDTIASADFSQTYTLLQSLLSGAQEPGPLSSSPASGTGLFALFPAQAAMFYQIKYSGLTGSPISGTHFHNQAAGVSGPIVRDLFPGEQHGLTTPAGTFQGIWSSSDPTQDPPASPAPVRPLNAPSPVTPGNTLLDELLADRIYFDIHTLPNFPSGEIRGQILNQGVFAFASGTGGVRNFEVVDKPPALSVSDATTTEGGNMQFTVSLSQPATSDVHFSYTTFHGTATANVDYDDQSVPVDVTISAGQTSKIISIQTLQDGHAELPETFNLNIANPTNAVIADNSGTGTIIDDDLSSFFVSDVSHAEGNAGQTAFTFTVSRSGFDLDNTSTVDYFTSQGTALSGSDYQATSGSLTFLPNQTERTVTVYVNGDRTSEPNETFFLNLTSPFFATLSNSQAEGTIVNDDSRTVSVNDISVTEGNSGTKSATFTLSLSSAAGSNVVVQYSTPADDATKNVDYVYKTGSVTFAPGQTSKTVTVQVKGDTAVEPNEHFRLKIASVSGPATIGDGTGICTIVNDDPSAPAKSKISIAGVSVLEGNSGSRAFQFKVVLDKASSSPVTVKYATSNGTATAGSDYNAISLTTLTFAPNETTKFVTVLVKGDTSHEADETFFLNLSSATNATISVSKGTGTIRNDD